MTEDLQRLTRRETFGCGVVIAISLLIDALAVVAVVLIVRAL